MARLIDVDAYLRRIRYSGSLQPTRATLDALIAHHVQAVPFENLDVLLGLPISLEPAAVDAKVLGGRGGYCFEQNTLFLRVLLELGYAARPISARVRLDRPRDFTPPRTHVFLRVELEGESLLADVGVGGLSPTCSLRLVMDEPQTTPHEARRLLREEGRYFHQARLNTGWQDVCEFTLEEMPEIDREVANWFTSAHPLSHFKSRLVVARALPGGRRVSILNQDLTQRAADGTAEKTHLATRAELGAALRTHFDLHLPDDAPLRCPALSFSGAS